MARGLLRSLGSIAGGASRGISQANNMNLQKRKMALLENQQKAQKQQELLASNLKHYSSVISDAAKAISGIKGEQAVQEGPPMSADQQKQQLIGMVKKIGDQFSKDPNITARLQGDIERLSAIPTQAQIDQENLKLEAEKLRQELTIKSEDDKPDTTGPIVTLEKDGDIQTIRRDSAMANDLLAQGYKLTEKQTVSSEVVLPILKKIMAGQPLKQEERTALREAQRMNPIQQLIDRSLNAPNDLAQHEELVAQAKEAIGKGKNREAVIQRLRDRGVPEELIRGI